MYDQQVQQGNIPGGGLNVQATPEAMGGGVAQGASALADAGTDVALQAKQRGDEIMGLAAAADLGERYNKIEADMRQKRGMDALGAHDAALADFDQQAADVASTLKNDTQRQQFAQLAAGRRLGLSAAAMEHTAREVQSVDDQAFAGFLSTSQAAAVANANNPDRVEAEAFAQRVRIEQYAKRNGSPPEWVQAQIQNHVGGTYADVIRRTLTDGNDIAARDLYTKWKDQIPGNEQAQLDQALEIASTRAESQRQSDAILAAAPDRAAALDAVAKISDPKLRDATQERVEHQLAVRDATARQDAETLYDSLDLKLRQNGGDLGAISPADFAKLSPQHREALSVLGTQIASGRFTPDNSDQYYALRDAAVQTPGQFAQADLRRFRAQLSPKDYASLQDTQQKIREGQANPGKLVEWSLVDRVAKRALDGLGLGNADVKDDKDALAKANAFRNQLDRAVEANAAITGKAPSEQDAQKIADELTQQVSLTKPGRFWGTNTQQLPAFQTPNAGKLVFRLEDVDPTKRLDLADRLRKGGVKNVTADMIVHAYNVELASKAANAGE